ncbi:MAG: hypothetical protein J7525_19710 [Roseofilum sp. SID3]|uniref:hypothetical protein n=1 Tax=Roseofilum sp. SID3 TaxID=2821499 RepID=UPI001B05537C|nr:hypothetical protein [Roseofilum sp. SID3]MBP0015323.1 hypothetical protein [Roseofilum sp. SID3]
MPNVSFTEPLYLFSERGYKPKVQLEKTGYGEASVTVWSTGGIVSQRSSRPMRATKLSRSEHGDFFSRREEITWGAEEEGVKEYEVIIHDDEEEGEAPEYFYITLRPGIGVTTHNWRTHCFILDGDGSTFFNKYVELPYNLKQNEAPPVPVGVKQILPFKVAIADTNGNEYPPELLGNMFTDPEFFKIARNMPEPLMMNICEVQDLGAFTMFNGEFHLEHIELPGMQSIDRYNRENNAQFTQYSHVFLKLPFTNPTDMAIPLNLTASQFWMFREMHEDERQEQVNGSMTATLLPKSDRVMFEFAKGPYKTTLCGFWSETQSSENRPSMHIFIGGIVPNAA